MKRIKYILFVLIVSIIFLVSLNTSLASENYIDEVGILSEETKQKLNNQNLPDGAKIKVVVKKDVDKLGQYSQEYLRNNKIGAHRNGLLILVSIHPDGRGDLLVRSERQLGKVLEDEIIRSIIKDNSLQYFLNGETDKGISKTFDTFNEYINSPETQEEIVNSKKWFKNLLIKWKKSAEDNPEVSIYSFIFICFLFFMVVIYPILCIKQKIIDSKVKYMTYKDFITGKERNSYDNLYIARLKELTKDKNSTEIKADMNRIVVYKDIFKKVYIDKVHKEVLNSPLVDSLENAENITTDEDRKIYADAISYKLKKMSQNELSSYMNMKKYSMSFLINGEYARRLKVILSKMNTEELISYRGTYSDEYLDRESIKNIVDGIIENRMREMTNAEIERLKSKIDSLEWSDSLHSAMWLNEYIKNN